ncbi:MAG: hypothetical protein GY835_09030 [bacterium]|nr:hypothetical protein [bacterium]
MRRVALVFLGIIGITASTMPTVVASEPTGLKIVNKSYDSESGKLTLELLNTSSLVVTAWHLSIVEGDAMGHEVRTGSGSDSYYRIVHEEAGLFETTEWEPGLIRSGPLFPGQSRRIELDASPTDDELGYSVISVVVGAVVYDDGTYEGDADNAKAILAHRAAEVAGTAKLVSFLQSETLRQLSPAELAEELMKRSGALRIEISTPSPEELAQGGAPYSVGPRTDLADQLVELARAVLRNPGKAGERLKRFADDLQLICDLSQRHLGDIAVVEHADRGGR